MKRSSYQILIYLSLVISLGCSKQQTVEKKRGMPDGVKTITQITYKIQKESGKLQKTLDCKEIYKYDKKGNNIEQYLYDANGKLQKRWVHEYNAKGGLVRYRSYNAYGKLLREGLTKCDDKGNAVEIVFRNPHDPIEIKGVYKYDENKDMIEYTAYAMGQVMVKCIYKNDDRGRCIELLEYDRDGKLERKTISKYDDKDKTFEETAYRIKRESGKEIEIPIESSVFEYEFYPGYGENK